MTKVPGTGVLPAISPVDAARYLYRAGFPAGQVAIGVAVGVAESTLIPDNTNVNPGDRGTDWGTWQINDKAHPEFAAQFANGTWKDPATNAQMAYSVWKAAGNSWSPWTTFTGSQYSTNLILGQKAQQEAAAGGASTASAPPPVGAVSDAVAVEAMAKGLIGKPLDGSTITKATVGTAVPPTILVETAPVGGSNTTGKYVMEANGKVTKLNTVTGGPDATFHQFDTTWWTALMGLDPALTSINGAAQAYHDVTGGDLVNETSDKITDTFGNMLGKVIPMLWIGGGAVLILLGVVMLANDAGIVPKVVPV